MARQTKLQNKSSQFETNARGKNSSDFILARIGNEIDKLRREENIKREDLAKLLAMGATTLDRSKIGTKKFKDGRRMHIYDWSNVNFSVANLVALANKFDMQFEDFSHYLVHGKIKSNEEIQREELEIDFLEELKSLSDMDRVRFLVSSTAFLKMNKSKTIRAIRPIFYLDEDDIINLANDASKKLIEKNERS